MRSLLIRPVLLGRSQPLAEGSHFGLSAVPDGALLPVSGMVDRLEMKGEEKTESPTLRGQSDAGERSAQRSSLAFLLNLSLGLFLCSGRLYPLGLDSPWGRELQTMGGRVRRRELLLLSPAATLPEHGSVK